MYTNALCTQLSEIHALITTLAESDFRELRTALVDALDNTAAVLSVGGDYQEWQNAENLSLIEKAKAEAIKNGIEWRFTRK
jgi:hypothetical protein